MAGLPASSDRPTDRVVGGIPAARSDGESDVPLTERLLRRLPGPRPVWVVAWALIAPLRPVVLVVVLGLTGEAARVKDFVPIFVSQAIFAWVNLVLLWGNPRLIERVAALTPALESLSPSASGARPFERLTSPVGPTVLTVALVAIATLSTATEFGIPVAVIDVPFVTLMILPSITFAWTYAVVLIGMDRLGRLRLALDVYPQDRTLGLGPVGEAALFGFWLVLIAGVPVLLLTGSDVTTFGLSLAVLTVTVLLFILSMLRLHDQMRAAKARYVAMARALVADAYQPIRASTSLETLEANASALSAAQSLAERAERILEWPIDERMVALMTVVMTGVVTSLIVRLVLQAIGI